VLLGPRDLFLVVLATGIAFSAIAGCWVGARWYLLPLVAMGVEIVIALFGGIIHLVVEAVPRQVPTEQQTGVTVGAALTEWLIACCRSSLFGVSDRGLYRLCGVVWLTNAPR
jgi:hypothetical protein